MINCGGCKRLLFGKSRPHTYLSVDQDVAAEDQGSYDAVAELDARRLREEGRHEAEQDKDPERAEQVGHPRREVVLGLASEERQGDKDAESEDERFDHDPAIVEGGNDADAVCLKTREARKEDEVHRVGLSLPERKARYAVSVSAGPDGWCITYSMNPIAPNNDTHIIHWLLCIHAL